MKLGTTTPKTLLAIALSFFIAGGTIGYLGTRVTSQSPAHSTLEKAEQALAKHDTARAFTSYLSALSHIPHLAKIFYGLALTCQQAKNHDLAIAFLQVAHTLDRNNPKILLALAQEYVQSAHKDKAAALLKQLTQQTLSTDLTLQVSRFFADIGLFDDALTYAERATRQEPQNPITWAHLANIHNRQGNLDAAVTLYKKALAIKGTMPNVMYNLGYTLKRLGHLEEALTYFNRAIELKPGYLDAIIDRAYTYWALGDFKRAWKDYAWRFKMQPVDPTIALKVPLWDGRDLTGKTILLYAEQGLGDTLQFIRFAESVKKMGNPRIICKVQKPLVKLLQSYPYIDKLVTTYDTIGVDFQAPLMSMPGILNLTPQTIHAPKSYLAADKKLVAEWKKKLSATEKEFRVGLCWFVDQVHEKDKSPVSYRSVPLTDFLVLGDIPHVSFYSLQEGAGLAEVNKLPESFKLTTFDAYFDKRHGSFMDSAAIIANMDLVITVDTAIAHLAGALGKKVWMLLPFSADGRWSIHCSDTPWYPTATLFRQTQPYDWKTPIKKMHDQLQQLVLKKENHH